MKAKADPRNAPFVVDTTQHCLGCWPKRASQDVHDVDYTHPGRGLMRSLLCAECREAVEVLFDRGPVNLEES